MRHFRLAWCLVALLGLALPVDGGEVVLKGTWKLGSISAQTGADAPVALLRLTQTDGALKGAVVDSRLKGAEVKEITFKSGTLRVVLRSASGGEQIFEGRVAEGGKTFKGSYGDAVLTPATLVPVEGEKITREMTASLNVPSMTRAAELTSKVSQILTRYLATKDKEKRAAILKEYLPAAQAAQKELPALYRETISKHADSPLAVDAVLALMRNRAKPAADDARAWIAAVNKVAAGYGKRYEAYVAAETAKLALTPAGLTELALEQATRAEKLLDASTSVDRAVTVLTTLEAALKKLGKADEAKALAPRLAKLNEAQDREYLAKMPPFQVKKFAGRRGTSDRAVVMELFTGATCPPCVAADLAFDGLAKAYASRDLVLIQYHVHIPGPDPMTNPDTEARWAYYRDRFAGQVRGVPSSLFNGKPQAGGGGGIAAAESKYQQYREIIDPLLEEPAAARLSASANRVGDKVKIEAAVKGLNNDANVKLRLLLVEETVRYVGSNKIRFHHQVVRAFPGGVDGVAVKGNGMKHTAAVDLAELRKQLDTYLDDYAANKRAFANPARPLAFANLRVIALLQNDETAEILQATQAEVAGDRGGR